jgi:adenylosuccinate lyase
VQRAAMEALAGHGAFRRLLWDDADVRGRFTAAEWDALFDVEPYFRYVDTIFERIGIETDDEAHTPTA